MTTLKTRSLGAAFAVAAALTLASCGGSESSDSATDPVATDQATSPSASAAVSASADSTETSPAAVPSIAVVDGVPTCATLWVDGQTMPRRYKGCLDDSGTLVKAKKKQCSLGLPMVEFDNRFYAMAGGKVNDAGDLATSADYQSALSSCQA